MEFQKEELDKPINNNLNNITFHKIPYVIMHEKNMCVLIYEAFAVSYQHDSALKMEIVDNTRRGISMK